MIPKADRTTHVAPATLDTRDEPRQRRQESGDAAQLAALLARIEAARTLGPQPHELHCRDCFTKGRDAAIRAILGTED